MAFKNPKTEEMALLMEQNGVMSPQIRRRMEAQERVDGEEFSVADLLNNGIDPYKVSNSQWVAFQNAVEETSPSLGQMVETRRKSFTEQERNRMLGQTKPVGGELGELVKDFQRGWSWISDKLGAGREDRNAFLQTTRDLQQALERNGYNVRIGDLQKFTTIEEVNEYLENDLDLSPAMFDDVWDQAADMEATRIVADGEAEDALAEDEEYTRLASENPEYVKNYRGFIKMDRAVPGKYKFDPQTGAIYDVAVGAYVDSSGRTLTTEEQIRSEYGLTEADPLPGLQERALEEQWQPPWLNMGIDEESYVSIMDVVKNKSGYGADPVRYAPGMESFLGGFASDYVVSRQDFSVREQAMLDFNMGTGAGEREAIFNPEYWNDLSNRVVQETRRPWYDQNDNWNLFVGLSPESVATVQRTLIDWGALDPEEVVLGVWGPAEAQQMNQVMTVANARGVQWTDASISQLMPTVFQDQTKAATPRSAFTPEPYRPMDPATVERTVKDSIRQMLGREPTEEDMATLGGYLTDNHSSAYAADVAAAKQQYSAQGAALDAGAQFGDPGVGPAEVDWESRYINKMEERFAPQLASQERGERAAQQQDMGVAMSNLMSQLGGGIG